MGFFFLSKSFLKFASREGSYAGPGQGKAGQSRAGQARAKKGAGMRGEKGNFVVFRLQERRGAKGGPGGAEGAGGAGGARGGQGGQAGPSKLPELLKGPKSVRRRVLKPP